MIVGVDYHPEQWPEERWAEDLRLMREAGISLVRLGHLAWAHIEPDDNYFNFRWLTRILDLLLQHGMKALLAIPINVPPFWLVHKFPDVLPVDADGRRAQPGTFNHRCFLSKHYRDYARKFTVRYTKELWGHRSILGWQIDGTLSARRCYCETCHRAFLDWLIKRYGKTDTLNEHWNTVAWSQSFSDFAQVPLPWRRTGAGRDSRLHHPSLVLDFWRFSAEAAVEFAREEVALVKRHTTRQLITAIVPPLSDQQNSFAVAEPLDVVATDFFPLDPERQDDALLLEAARSLKQRPFWVLGQQVAAVGWNALAPSLRAGQVRLHAWRSFAHGAEAVLWDKWRSSPGGTDQLGEGILRHDSLPRRRYHEIKQVGGEISRLADSLRGSEQKNAVAILWDVEQHWALQIQPQVAGHPVDCLDLARRFHLALQSLGLGADLVPATAPFTKYRLLLLPPLYLLDPAAARKLHEFIAQGGHAVFSTRSGIKDLHNVHLTEPLPAHLRTLLGIEIEEFDVLGPDRVNRVRMRDGQEFTATAWCDVLCPRGAEVLAAYAAEPYPGAPAITVRSHGTGRAYYIGSVMEPSFYRRFLRDRAEELGLHPFPELPEDVELVVRQKAGRELLFLLNRAEQPRTVTLCRKGTDLLSGNAVAGALTLPADGVAIVQVE